jgi:hypothetical protein
MFLGGGVSISSKPSNFREYVWRLTDSLKSPDRCCHYAHPILHPPLPTRSIRSVQEADRPNGSSGHALFPAIDHLPPLGPPMGRQYLFLVKLPDYRTLRAFFRPLHCFRRNPVRTLPNP